MRDRLLKLAKQRGEDFNFVLTRYAVERLLYRISKSKHCDRFVLKGATMFQVWGLAAHRATKDVDLLGSGDNTPSVLIKLFGEVINAEVEPDGLTFDAATLNAEPISIEAEYKGVRVTMMAKLGSARVAVQADIGFGDAVTPKPKLTTLPVMLDQPAAKIRAYAKETVVAEKFHAMVHLGMLNSRMKDYFDLWVLANSFEFESEQLAEAIKATFERRQTPVPTESPEGLSERFVKDKSKQVQWAAFIKRVDSVHRSTRFEHVVDRLREFLLPVSEIAAGKSRRQPKWSSARGWQ